MEEVDQIILNSLNNIGCEFAEGMECLKDMSTENVVEATVRCLKIINPDFKMSTVYPPGMSARFRVGSSIAQQCQKLGYTGSVGYQTFLYSAESDIRKIFMFLVEKLPKQEGIKEDDSGSASILQKRIGQALRAQCSSLWLPQYCKAKHASIHFCFRTHNLRIPDEQNSGSRDSTPFVHQQLSEFSDLTPSLLELNTNGIASNGQKHIENLVKPTAKETRETFRWKNSTILCEDALSLSASFEEVIQQVSGQSADHTKQSRFVHAKNLQFTKTDKLQQAVRSTQSASDHVTKQADHAPGGDVTPGSKTEAEADEQAAEVESETEEERFEREIGEKKAAIGEVERGKDEDAKRIEEADLLLQQIRLKNEEADKELQAEEENYKLKMKTVKLLPNADENIAKLKTMIQASKDRLLQLSAMWEERRVPLIQQLRHLVRERDDTQDDSERRMEEIRVIRQRMKEAIDQTKTKDDVIKQLTSELDGMKRDTSRQSYTRRILEIVASIHKQKQEIARVIAEMRDAQKEVNRLRGRIERTFTIADEIIFRNAKKDENHRQAYKYLVSLHDSCVALIDTVEDTGSIMREIRELEGQIDAESSKNAEENLAKMLTDFREMKKENQVLMKKLKQRS